MLESNMSDFGLLIMQDNRLKIYNTLYININNAYRDVLKKFNMSESTFDILYSLRIKQCEPYQNEIINSTNEPKQTINSSLKKLEKEKIIVLIQEGKRKKIELTLKGDKLCKQTIDKIIKAEAIAYSEVKDFNRMIKDYEKFYIDLRKEFEKI